MNLYCLKDKKASTVSAPFAAQADGVAMRYVMDSLADGHSTVSKYPSDFQLLHVGAYDEQEGMLSPAGGVRVVVEVDVLAQARKSG